MVIDAHKQKTGLLESKGDSCIQFTFIENTTLQVISSQISPKLWFEFASKATKNVQIYQILKFFHWEKGEINEVSFYFLLQLQYLQYLNYI